MFIFSRYSALEGLAKLVKDLNLLLKPLTSLVFSAPTTSGSNDCRITRTEHKTSSNGLYTPQLLP